MWNLQGVFSKSQSISTKYSATVVRWQWPFMCYNTFLISYILKQVQYYFILHDNVFKENLSDAIQFLAFLPLFSISTKLSLLLVQTVVNMTSWLNPQLWGTHTSLVRSFWKCCITVVRSVFLLFLFLSHFIHIALLYTITSPNFIILFSIWLCCY